ncbi:MAG TPA: DUF6789 family protein [Isosphaeraceae bacterium]
MEAVLRGALAGCVGTTTMTAAMAAAQAAGMMAGEVPPRRVAGNLEAALGVRAALSRPAFEASWLAQHFAYGAAAGAVYAVARERLGGAEPLIAGPLYGIALWAFGYAGWAPLTGLYPWPTEEPRRRVATEVASHLIYGAATALAERRLRCG